MRSSLAVASLCGLTVAALEYPVPQLWSTNSVQVVTNGSTVWPWLKFVTTDEQPPYLEINSTGEPLGPGLIFYTPTAGVNAAAYISRLGPVISTDTGDLVWAGPADPDASNFKVQELNGEPVVTYWEGTGAAASGLLAGHGYGQVNILNSSYGNITTICPQLNLTKPPNQPSSCDADVHESYITDYGTILVTAYNITNADLSSVGGPRNGYVFDSLLVEIDIRTRDILFVWSPLEHVPLNASNLPLAGSGNSTSNAWDFFHANAIQAFEGGYVFNSRHTWTTYYIDRSGNIVWQINGKTGGDFGSLPQGGNFSWQHDARVQRHSPTQLNVTWFNNANDVAGQTNITTGVQLLLSDPPNPATPPQLLANVSDHQHPLYVSAEGSHSIISSGDHFLGYGYEPYIKQFTAAGDLLWSARYAYLNGASAYRAFKQEWHAVPSTPPALVVRQSNSSAPVAGTYFPSSLRGYVSWNGATDVVGYNVYAGSGNSSLTLVGYAPKRGFETEFYVPTASSVKVGALVVAINGTVVQEVNSTVVSVS